MAELHFNRAKAKKENEARGLNKPHLVDIIGPSKQPAIKGEKNGRQYYLLPVMVEDVKTKAQYEVSLMINHFDTKDAIQADLNLYLEDSFYIYPDPETKGRFTTRKPTTLMPTNANTTKEVEEKEI